MPIARLPAARTLLSDRSFPSSRQLRLLICPALIGLQLNGMPALSAQNVRVGVERQIPMGPMDEMEDMLSQADARQKVDLLTRMGIHADVAKTTAEELLPGQRIELHPVRAPGGRQLGVAYLPSFRCCALYLIEQNREGNGNLTWQAIDRTTLDCWDGEAPLEVLPLRTPGYDDLVLHHVNLGHGSGYLEDQTQVFSIFGDKLVKVMETADLQHEEMMDTGAVTEQRSTFLRFPGGLYEETRATSVDDVTKTVERRYWHWSPSENKFVTGAFVPALAPHR